MAYLGTPYRVLYEAKNFLSGLTSVKAFVVKPDNSVAGLYTLSEYAFQSMSGLYYFDLMTSITDIEGEWTVMVLSPSESIRYTHKVSLQRNPAIDIRILISNFSANGMVEALNGYVDLQNEVTQFIESSAELSGFISTNETESEILTAEITGSADTALDIEGDIYHGL